LLLGPDFKGKSSSALLNSNLKMKDKEG